jgi:hypothetical protein
MQNIEPKVTQVGSHYEIVDSGGWLCSQVHSSVSAHNGVDISTYGTQIHTIGIGIEANWAGVLQDVANQTGGFYLGTNDPQIDLDLVYFVHLCNCMAGASPTLIHHNAGRLVREECRTIESFRLSRSIRKITVMLSWQRKEMNNLFFWLVAPDGTLLNLHREMKLFDSHCLATIYLPRDERGKDIESTGQWKMLIGGEMQDSYADYHALVIAEDREVKFDLDFPRKRYEVGDLLPLRISLTEIKEPAPRINDILVEVASLRMPLAQLFAEYKTSSSELLQWVSAKCSENQGDPMFLKLEKMSSDPYFSERLKPSRSLLSLQKGNLTCNINEKEILIPLALQYPGLSTFKITVQCETQRSGPINRTSMVAVWVHAGKVNREQSSVSCAGVKRGQLTGGLIHITPKNKSGQLLGPGMPESFKAFVGREIIDAEAKDLLNGTYQVELLIPKRIRARAKGRSLIARILFDQELVWEGAI